VRGFEGGQDGIKIVSGEVGRQAAKAIIAAEFDDHDFRVRARMEGRLATASLVVAPLVPLLTTL